MSSLLAVALCLSLAAPTSASTPDTPRVGAPFGALVLPTVDRQQVLSLESFRGRKLLLLEFASW